MCFETGIDFPTYPSQTPIKLCSRPDEETNTVSAVSKLAQERQLTKITSRPKSHRFRETDRFSYLPGMTVLFPSTTTRGFMDNEESITFPSISLPQTTKGTVTRVKIELQIVLIVLTDRKLKTLQGIEYIAPTINTSQTDESNKLTLSRNDEKIRH